MSSNSPQYPSFTREPALEETAKLLSGMALFSRLDAATLQELAGKARFVRLPRREVLIKNGQKINELHCVVEGILKVYLLSCSGQQRVVSLIHPGESVGEALIVNRQPVPFFAETLTPTKLLILPAKDLLDLLTVNSQAGMGLIQILSQKIQTLLQDLEGCCLQNALQRIAQYLCSLGCELEASSDQASSQQQLTIELPASKVVVASLLNLSAESLSRGLHQLAAEGLISIRRRQIDLHQPDILQEIASGQLQIGGH